MDTRERGRYLNDGEALSGVTWSQSPQFTSDLTDEPDRTCSQSLNLLNFDTRPASDIIASSLPPAAGKQRPQVKWPGRYTPLVSCVYACLSHVCVVHAVTLIKAKSHL